MLVRGFTTYFLLKQGTVSPKMKVFCLFDVTVIKLKLDLAPQFIRVKGAISKNWPSVAVILKANRGHSISLE